MFEEAFIWAEEFRLLKRDREGAEGAEVCSPREGATVSTGQTLPEILETGPQIKDYAWSDPWLWPHM